MLKTQDSQQEIPIDIILKENMEIDKYTSPRVETLSGFLRKYISTRGQNQKGGWHPRFSSERKERAPWNMFVLQEKYTHFLNKSRIYMLKKVNKNRHFDYMEKAEKFAFY